MKKIFILVALVGAILYFLTPAKRESSPSETAGNNITIEHALEQKEKGLFANSFGGGGGKCPGKFDMLSMGFKYGGKLTIGESRQLLVESVNNYLKVINQEKNLPFLYYVPFKADHVEYVIDTNYTFDPHLELTLGSDNKNEISYLILNRNIVRYNIFKGEEGIVEVYRETFEEAERIVNEEKMHAHSESSKS